MSRSYGTMSESPGAQQNGEEVTRLVDLVADNIQIIKTNTSAIEKAIRIVGSPRDSAEYRDNAVEAQKKTNEIISLASGNLGQLNQLVRGQSKQRRLHAEKLTSEFHQAVQKYSDSQQKLLTKIRKTLLVSHLDQDNEDQSNASGQSGPSQQQQLQYQLQLDDARMRENQMREIESVVVDVNEIMMTLASQIQEQGQHISSIESNIENVQGNVEEGAAQLQKAATYQNKYRKKVLILLVIAVVIGVIVTSVVISDIKS